MYTWLALIVLCVGLFAGVHYAYASSVLGQVQVVALAVYEFALWNWQWLLKLWAGLSFYDLFWLALLPRLSRAILFDAPWRWFMRNILPLLFLSPRVRAILRRRAELLKQWFVGTVKCRWQSTQRLIEPLCGKRSSLVMWTVLSFVLFLVLFLLSGVVFLLAVVPIPHTVARVLWWPVRMLGFILQKLIATGKQIAVRTGVFYLFAKLWDNYGFRLMTEERRRELRRRHRILIRGVIERRKQVDAKLDGLHFWDKATVWWFAFWDRRFARLEGKQTSATSAGEPIQNPAKVT